VAKPVKSGVGGWLLVLCILLIGWQPIELGLVASSALDELAIRGLPLAVLLTARLVVAGLGIAAGLALLGRMPAAVSIAKLSLIVSLGADLFVYATPYWPASRVPGDAPLYVAASLTYYGLWLAYLFRSDRVRRTFT
jgi:hypothetical protein